jgi:hypothetical protein
MGENDIVIADRTSGICIRIAGRLTEGVFIIPVLVEDCLDSIRLDSEGTDDGNLESVLRSRASRSYIKETKITDTISLAPHAMLASGISSCCEG